jgi:CMP-N,N'-diacetyllegionaminic acid synthase
MNILITICARGGSKGIPGKNIKMLNGKPLIYYTIQSAKKFQKLFNVDICLSSDSEEIISISSKLGLITKYLRPKNLAQDSTGKIPTIKHALLYYEKLNKKKYDFILDLDVTSPLRTIEDLLISFKEFRENGEAYNIFSVNKANRNPYFNVVEKNKNGFYSLVKKGSFLSRQSAPSVFDMNASFYFYKRIYFDKKINSSISSKSLVYVMPHICFDLDNPFDFDYMDYLLKNNKLDFEI